MKLFVSIFIRKCFPICMLFLFVPLAVYASIVDLVSVSNTGEQGNGHSQYPALSYDARYVTFKSTATNLVSGVSNGNEQVYLYDRILRVMKCVSMNNIGDSANGDCYAPTIDYSGRYIVYASDASNLVPNDTNGHPDIFLYDSVLDNIKRVDVDNYGNQITGAGGFPSISGNGRYVVYNSSDSTLVPGDTNGVGDVFVYDTNTETVEMVSVNDLGMQGDDESVNVSINGDGRYVAFDSYSTNLVSDVSGGLQVYVFDRLNRTIECVSRDEDGNPGGSGSAAPYLSGDGEYVAFNSDLPLVSEDINGIYDTYIYGRINHTIHLLGLGTSSVLFSPAGSTDPTLSFAGEYSSFLRYSVSQCYRRDILGDITEMVSTDEYGSPGSDSSQSPFISPNGNCVAFSSSSTNLVAGDTNGFRDIFIKCKQPLPTLTPTITSTVTNTSTIIPTFTNTVTPSFTPTMTTLPNEHQKPCICPNPSDGTQPVILNLAPGTTGEVTIKIFTIAYRMITEMSIDATNTDGSISLPMNDLKNKRLSNGVYYIQITTHRNESICKWLILK